MVKVLLDSNKEIYLDGYLKSALDSLAYNINKDWDFVIVVTGDGMVRTGKSVLAMTVAAYLSHLTKTTFDINHVHFDSQSMIDLAQTSPQNSVFVYDEAREGLASAKRFSKVQQDLIDFFNECGQLNQIFILVLPDYFGLNWELATNRSECLLNVYRKERNIMGRLKGTKEKIPLTVFDRGYFEFYNRKKKSDLFWKAKRAGLRNYGMVKSNFVGSFTNNYPIDETLYREKKREALKRFNDKHKEEKVKRISMGERAGYVALTKLKERGENFSKLGTDLGHSDGYFKEAFKSLKKKIEKDVYNSDIDAK